MNRRVADLKRERSKAEEMVHGWHEERETRRREMVEAVCRGR